MLISNLCTQAVMDAIVIAHLIAQHVLMVVGTLAVQIVIVLVLDVLEPVLDVLVTVMDVLDPVMVVQIAVVVAVQAHVEVVTIAVVARALVLVQEHAQMIVKTLALDIARAAAQLVVLRVMAAVIAVDVTEVAARDATRHAIHLLTVSQNLVIFSFSY